MRAKYVLSEVALGLWRNVTMTIAMIITMAVSLALLGASLLMYLLVQDMREAFYADVEVTIFLADDITDAQRQALGEQLASDPLVADATYESRADAYERFREQFADAPELVEATRPDALPESYRVQLEDPEQFEQILNRYADVEGVDEIVDQRNVLSRLFGILGAIQNLALVIAIVQGIAALMLVVNTIQIAAYSKRREVAIMKLVGASNWFVQAPFVLEAVFAGVLGAIVAYGTLILGKIFLVDGALEPLFLAGVLTPLSWGRIHLMLPVLAGIAAFVSAVTGWLTLRFYIKV